MSDGMLTFVSWVRRGLAAGYQNPDGTSAGPNATVRIDVEFNSPVDATTYAQLELVGPGDIAGLDSSVIVRRWPRPNDLDSEFASYALMEFDQADLPWRYTPATASGSVASEDDRLRPWFSLLVVESGEATLNPSTPEQKLQVLQVDDQSTLPPAQLWAWSHTQFEGEALDEDGARARITGTPGLFSARLLSPRLLRANTDYIACLVPTFERGRQAGLGLTPPLSVDALQPAWDSEGSGPIELPAYHAWRFRTGELANFEDAASRLRPHILPATVGHRAMDVAAPGLDLPAATPEGVPLYEEGALLSLAAYNEGRPEWTEPERSTFIDALKGLVNAPAAADPGADPVLAPPLYGQWYAAQATLSQPRPSGTNPPWFHELNADPRSRSAAALGTKVIQNEQQALLAAGWDQVEEIRTINDRLRGVQLGRGVLSRLFLRHFRSVSIELLYHLTAKVHARVQCGDRTVCRRIAESPIPRGLVGHTWLRISRTHGPIGRIQGRPSNPGFESELVHEVNNGRGPTQNPTIAPPHRHGDGPLPGWGIRICELVDTLGELGSETILRWALAIYWTYRKLLVSQNGECWWLALRSLRLATVLIQIAIDSRDIRRRCRYIHLTYGPSDVAEGDPMPGLDDVPSIPEGDSFPVEVTTLPIPGEEGTEDSELAGEIRGAVEEVLIATQPPETLETEPPMNLEACHTALTIQLQPNLTVGQRVTDRISIDSATVPWSPRDPLEPILVHPEYERPMYVPLKAISSSWLLPGIEELKPNTVSLAVSNQRFIEAYMVGLNHEMTRELLWNEFPTDQRGTYFRQFWSISSHVLENGSTLPIDGLRDIRPIRQWDKDARLGDSSPRTPPGGTPDVPFLVMIVKAQLIQKYPNVIVYAQRINQEGTSLTGEQRYPVFDASIGEDATLFGFDLTQDEIRNDPRWYFVFEEQPGEPKFADEVTARETNRYTDPESFGSSAGRFAQAALAQPYRLGIQGTSLLP